MSFLAKEYEIPFLGKVELIEASGYDKSLNGNYYATNKELGDFAIKCVSVCELIKEVKEKVEDYLKKQKTFCESKIEKQKKELGELETILISLPKDKEDKEIEDWFKEYQTDNPLQLEYQDAEKQKENKK